MRQSTAVDPDPTEASMAMNGSSWTHSRIWTLVPVIALLGGACDATTPDSIGSQPVVATVAPVSASPELSSPIAATASAPASPPIVVGDGEAWIAYHGASAGPPRIRLVRPDGTGDHPLLQTNVPAAQEKPDWSPDGTRIAFRGEDTDGTLDIWVADATGEGLQRIVDCVDPCAWTDDPAWSPNGESIAFQQGTAVGEDGTGVGTVEVVDLATGEQRTVFTGAPTEYLYSPRWSPDGGSMVVEIDRFDSARLDASVVVESTIGRFVIGGSSPTFAPLLPWGQSPLSPDWHPTDGSIVFSQPVVVDGVAGREGIFVIDDSDAAPRPVDVQTGPAGRAIQPSWTPDGRAIIFVFEAIAGADPNVGFVNADGTDLVIVPEGATVRTHPRLRPMP